MNRVSLLVVCLPLIASGANAQAKAAAPAKAHVYQLDATPTTVAWGYYDAAAKAVLRIKSGESVRVHTLITSSPTRLEAAGVAAKDVEKDLRDIYEQVKEHGPGGHILTGPIYVEGAEPGDVLEIRFQKIELAIPYAYNGFGPRSGFIPEDYPYAKTKIIPLDARRMAAKFANGIEIPLHPFFGSVGDAPPPASGKLNSAPPSLQGGNLDNKSLVAGTTLYLPVYVPGALLEIGDGHAGMGDGEVDITALETSLYGTVQLVVRKDLHFTWPRAETPTEYISMGMNQDWNEAAKQALREMIDFLMKEKGLSKDDAYMLCSVAGDLHVTQLVDGNKGAHVTIRKEIFRAANSAKQRNEASPRKRSM